MEPRQDQSMVRRRDLHYSTFVFTCTTSITDVSDVDRQTVQERLQVRCLRVAIVIPPDYITASAELEETLHRTSL